MKPWNEVRPLFEQLLALPEGERRARLAEVMQRDPELGRELESLLAHDEQLAGEHEFLTPPASVAAPIAAWLRDAGESPANAGSPLPTRIGPYEIVRSLGRGGMGDVYLARRSDGAYQRRVAIKVIQGGTSDDSLLQRFQRERQVLANLDHPGIARLIEGGAAENGQPYLVMEYIEGVSIERYCDQERLPVPDRLRLFLGVCDAVQHAHQHLVVHRDIKPQNILVTPTGETKLLDFGIAKVLDPEKASAGAAVTLDFMRLLTPAYASPEQVSGRPVTTASDVYSLGAVLFQLLTGQLPYEVSTTSAAAIERAVCTVEPKRPSAAVVGEDAELVERARDRCTSPRGLAKILHGDLDWVVLKALRKEPRLRYASAQQLAEDLRNYLAGLPVTARADTFFYRASKFVRRHRVVVAVGAMLVSALALGLALTTYQYQRAERLVIAEQQQRSLAEQRLQQSEALAKERDEQRLRAEQRLLEVEQLNQTVEAQRQRAEQRTQEVQNFATKLIFDVHGAVLSLPGSAKVGEYIVKLGVDHLDRLAADAKDDARLLRELSLGYSRIADLQVAMGKSDLALQSADKAVAASHAALQARPGDPLGVFTLTSSTTMRANVFRALGQEERAMDEYRSAIEIGSPGVADPEAKFGLLIGVYTARAKLGQLLLPRTGVQPALQEFREARDLMARIVKRWPSDERQTELALMRITVAELLEDVGDSSEARKELGEAFDSLKNLAAKHPNDDMIGKRLRHARWTHAKFRSTDGDTQMAMSMLQQNREALAKLAAAPAVNFDTKLEQLANTEYMLRVLEKAGERQEALALLDTDLPLARALVAEQPTHPRAVLDLASMLRNRGELQCELGLALDAGQSLAEALQVVEKLLGQTPDFAEAQRELASVHHGLGRAHRQSARGYTDATLQRRALTQSVFHFEQAAQQLSKMTAAGVALLAQDHRLAEELDEAKAALGQ